MGTTLCKAAISGPSLWLTLPNHKLFQIKQIFGSSWIQTYNHLTSCNYLVCRLLPYEASLHFSIYDNGRQLMSVWLRPTNQPIPILFSSLSPSSQHKLILGSSLARVAFSMVKYFRFNNTIDIVSKIGLWLNLPHDDRR